ncbi:AtpZ/AtpI family protein [Citromicrobium sp. WPS32]|uniref:AtpZ/AtpI family protein n=1 Tax=Citromicrobium sp. WPS32 TaxID=1634517 RepID=UPI0006C921AE|nr:AtpZ/AtpI family protein [Citromicrobium sp. WPS32]KPM18128.1 ATP-binding protein [Citromicrobium sp. WPS32]
MSDDKSAREPIPEDARIDALEQRLKAAREREEKRRPTESARKADADYRAGNRVLAELLGGLLGGSVIGYGVDALAGTWPWGLLAGLFLGIGVAFRNMFRNAGTGGGASSKPSDEG